MLHPHNKPQPLPADPLPGSTFPAPQVCPKLMLRQASFERAFRELNRRDGRLPIMDASPALPELKKSARRMIEDALSRLSEVEPAGIADAALDGEPPFFLRLAGSWEEDAA